MTEIITEKGKKILEFLKNNPNSEIYKIMVRADIPTKKETKELVNDLRKLELVKTKFENGKRYFSIKSILDKKDLNSSEFEKPESVSLIPAEPIALIIYEPSEVKMPQEIPYSQKEKKKPITTQEKIDEACKKHSLDPKGLSKRILEALAEKPLTERDIRLKSKAKADIRGQIFFLREKGLIKRELEKGGKYKTNI